MRTRGAAVAALLLGALLSGCAGTGAPTGWLPTGEATQEEAHGAWITVITESVQRLGVDDYPIAAVEGELIAVHEDSLFVLVSDGLTSELVAVPKTPALKAKLGTYDPARGGIGAWVLLGSLSTVSHGVNLIFTLPIWLITGGVVGKGEGEHAIEYYPEEYAWDSFESLRVYARFPQGLTQSIDRTALEPRKPEKLKKDPPRKRERRR